jgi:single-strand DNA-binding protein
MNDDLNLVLLTGIVEEPKRSERGPLKFTLAVARDAEKDGETKTYKTWLDCQAWGKTAESFTTHVQEGDRVMLEGRIEKQSWEGKDGKKVYRTVVTAYRWQFFGSASSSGAPKASRKPEVSDHVGSDDELAF